MQDFEAQSIAHGKTRDLMRVEDEMLTISEAAELAGMSIKGIRQWITEGKLPAARYRNAYVISKVLLAMTIAALRQRQNDPAPSAESLGVQTLLTEKQVADVLGISRQRVNQLCLSGGIESVLFGKRYRRITKDALNAYVRQRTEGPAVRATPPDMLTVSEVAETLRVSEHSVRVLVHNRSLKAIRVGGQLRIFGSSLRGYLRRSAQQITLESVEPTKSQRAPKIVSVVTCTTCGNEYPRGKFAEHIVDAEHIRSREWKNKTSRV